MEIFLEDEEVEQDYIDHIMLLEQIDEHGDEVDEEQMVDNQEYLQQVLVVLNIFLVVVVILDEEVVVMNLMFVL